MVVEFMGMPGSGKTFISNALVLSLKQDSVKAINIIDKSRYNFFYKGLFKILKLMGPRRKVYREFALRLKRILNKRLDKMAKFNNCCIDTYINSIVFYCFLYDLFYHKRRLYIFDEGILQQLVNIMVNFNPSEEEINEILELFKGYHIPVIYLRVEIDDVLNSIKSRDRHDCYIDELEGEELINFLIKYQNDCERLCDKMGCVLIDRNIDIRNLKKFVFSYYKIGKY